MAITLSSLTTTLGLVARDHLYPVSPVRPEVLEKHLHAAVNWLLRAHSQSGNGGLAASYSPWRRSWAPAYPETTGYTIPTLLDYARRYKNEQVRQAALEMADYELLIQDSAGGFPALQERKGDPYVLMPFDTGQIVFGLLAAYAESGQEVYAEQYAKAAERACNWLLILQSPQGWWEGYYEQRANLAIDTRLAWALILAGKAFAQRRFLQAAVRQLDWTLMQQNQAGWFRYSSFFNDAPPVLHTLAYVAEGLLEAGLLLEDERYIAGAVKMAGAVAGIQREDGSIPGALGPDWKAAASWSCITGQAQMALIWLRMAETGIDHAYIEAAQRSLCYAASCQALEHPDEGVRGGLPGSRPIDGAYLRLKYPNWAAKFFVDAAIAYLRYKEGQVGVEERLKT